MSKVARASGGSTQRLPKTMMSVTLPHTPLIGPDCVKPPSLAYRYLVWCRTICPRMEAHFRSGTGLEIPRRALDMNHTGPAQNLRAGDDDVVRAGLRLDDRAAEQAEAKRGASRDGGICCGARGARGCSVRQRWIVDRDLGLAIPTDSHYSDGGRIMNSSSSNSSRSMWLSDGP